MAATTVEEVATGLEAPWSIAFANDSAIYLTERPGRVRIINNGVLSSQPLATINVTTFQGGEAGLLGLALDPDFGSNRHVYVYYTYNNTQDEVLNRVARWTESNGELWDEQVLLEGIKGGKIHDGGRLKIGPDGKLYVTTGDANNSTLAPDVSSLNGKILRLNLNGTVPLDNPIPNSPVYSYGHRNPQGLAWDNNGHLLESEHGPLANDEINLIRPGENYGWPTVTGTGAVSGLVGPILSSGTATWAPSGITFYAASNIPELTGKLLVATLRGEHLRVLDISFSPTAQVKSSTACLSDTYGRLRDVVQGPDGFLYIMTSNTDGRGTPNEGDDKILKISAIDCSPSGLGGFSQYFLYIAAGGAAALSFLALLLFRNRQRRRANARGDANRPSFPH